MLNTKLLFTDRPADCDAAAAILRSGGLCAVPTETVYGLAADALNPDAVRRIFEAKGRPQDNPLIVHVADTEDIYTLCEDVPATAETLARAFWPGPLTLVLKRKPVVPDVVCAGLPTVAVRHPAHPATRNVIRAAGVPLAAPSANRSGCPSPTTAAHVLHDLEGRIDAVLDGGPCDWGVESTVLDLTVTPPMILRPGGISRDALEGALGGSVLEGYQRDTTQNADVAEAPEAKEFASTEDETYTPKAPGMKYRHYAPTPPVLTLPGSIARAAALVAAAASRPATEAPAGKAPRQIRVLCPAEEAEAFGAYAEVYGCIAEPRSLMRGLFAALRRLDRPDVSVIFVRCPEPLDAGRDPFAAVRNRLTKAAAGRALAPRPLRIGLLGPSGAGKSDVLTRLQARGLSTLSADVVYHELLSHDEVLLQRLFETFPEAFVSHTTLDRRALGRLVFQDEARRQTLMALTHPVIRGEIQRRVDELSEAGALVAVIEAPVPEPWFLQQCDATIGLLAPLETRLRRVVSRDGLPEDYVRARMGAQPEDAYFQKNCTVCFCNEGDLEKLVQAVYAWIEQYTFQKVLNAK